MLLRKEILLILGMFLLSTIKFSQVSIRFVNIELNIFKFLFTCFEVIKINVESEMISWLFVIRFWLILIWLVLVIHILICLILITLISCDVRCSIYFLFLVVQFYFNFDELIVGIIFILILMLWINDVVVFIHPLLNHFDAFIDPLSLPFINVLITFWLWFTMSVRIYKCLVVHINFFIL